MRILIWHGYLLTGSGSNVYTANIARSWRRRGHQVLVLCQERDPRDLELVDEAGTVDAVGMRLQPVEGAGAAAGRCALARPAIGDVLPVYVYDDYEGFEVKVFTDLTDAELDRYVRRNVEALVTAIRAFAPDVIIIGHEVMGPEIARQACAATETKFLAKLHGSALEYAVKKQQRYRDYAISGLSAAATVVGGSRYMVEEAAAHIPGWKQKAVVVNPGCDVDLFRPTERRNGAATVGYVGKFIAAKGVHNLVASLSVAERPERAVLVGYGGVDRELRELADAVAAGDFDAARDVIASVSEPEMSSLATFLAHSPGDLTGRRGRFDVTFTGRLEHGPLAGLLPTFDVLAVPSVLPEAFGMVAAEAAAAGVLPVVPNHSGIGEAGAAVEEAIGRSGFLTYDADDPVRDLARALDRVLSMSDEERSAAERAARDLAVSRWSWDRVADSLLAHATR